MKKLLTILGSIGLVASTGVTSVVSCNPDKKDDSNNNNNKSDNEFSLSDIFTITDLGEVKVKNNKSTTIVEALTETLEHLNSQNPHDGLRVDAIPVMDEYCRSHKDHYDDIFKELKDQTSLTLTVDLNVDNDIVKGKDILKKGSLNVVAKVTIENND